MGTTATAERRDPTAPRRLFRATVDLAPDDDQDGWQADAMDLSISGMSVRTSMLPELGEQLAFHFLLADGRPVEGRGEVVWANDRGERAGAFGVKFAALTSEVEAAIRDTVGGPSGAPSAKADDTKVKLYIHGMDAPLRAKVRQRRSDVMILGSDLSFLRLGEKVEVDGAQSRIAGTIEAVGVEVDGTTGIPRLVLTIDLQGRSHQVTTPAVSAPLVARAVEPPPPEVTLSAAKSVVGNNLPTLDDPAIPAVPMELTARKPTPRSAQATKVLGDGERTPEAPMASGASPEMERTDEESDADGYDDEMDDMSPTPSWLKNAFASAKTLGGKAIVAAGPALRGATAAAGAFGQRMTVVVREKIQGRSTTPTPVAAPRNGLRPQHATDSDTGADGVPMGNLRTKRVVVYAAAGLTLAAGIVAVASTGGPRTTAPHPQVAVAATDTTVVAQHPTAAEPTEAAEPSEPSAALPPGNNARVVSAHGTLPPDLAGAQNSPSARADEQPILAFSHNRASRLAANPPAGAVRGRMAIAPSGHTAVFGNPAIRTGVTLHLRMDGPVERLSGAGARGGAIVLDVPGHHSLDVAAPLVRLDPRLTSASVHNLASGAELTLRFRQPAPPFVARAVGNSVEIVLGATPGEARSLPARSPTRSPLRHR